MHSSAARLLLRTPALLPRRLLSSPSTTPSPTKAQIKSSKEVGEHADDVLARHGGKIAVAALALAGYLFWSFYKASFS